MSMGALPVYLMFALFLLGVPVAIALIACVLPYFLFINPTMPPQMVLQRLVAQVESSSLWAVPFFITAGAVLNYAGVTKRLMNLCEGIGRPPAGRARAGQRSALRADGRDLRFGGVRRGDRVQNPCPGDAGARL